MSLHNFALGIPHLGLTKADFTTLLDALAELRRRVLTKHVHLLCNITLGVCFHWQELLPEPRSVEAYHLVRNLSKDWKHSKYPGEKHSCPVPHIMEFGKWEGPNLAMRLNLISYLRKRLQDLRRRAPDE